MESAVRADIAEDDIAEDDIAEAGAVIVLGQLPTCPLVLRYTSPMRFVRMAEQESVGLLGTGFIVSGSKPEKTRRF